MKSSCRVAVASRRKSKKQKKTIKSLSATNIAQRYMELRRLREQLAEAESWRNTR